VRLILAAPRAGSVHKPRWRVIAEHGLYVLQTLDMISFRMNTYTVVEAPLKTRYLNSFRMRTYRKSLRNAFTMNTYEKPRGVGVLSPP
jgi:hypothetical protein